MLIKVGRFGPFVALPAATPSAPTPVNWRSRSRKSETGGRGSRALRQTAEKPMVVKRGRFGPVFSRVSGYPECKTTRETDCGPSRGGLRAAQSRSDSSMRNARGARRTSSSSKAASASSPPARSIPSVGTSSTRPRASNARRTLTRAARSSSANRVAAKCSSDARTIPTAIFVLWNRPNQRAVSQVRDTAPDGRRRPRSTVGRFCAPTRTATTRGLGRARRSNCLVGSQQSAVRQSAVGSSASRQVDSRLDSQQS